MRLIALTAALLAACQAQPDPRAELEALRLEQQALMIRSEAECRAQRVEFGDQAERECLIAHRALAETAQALISAADRKLASLPK